MGAILGLGNDATKKNGLATTDNNRSNSDNNYSNSNNNNKVILLEEERMLSHTPFPPGDHHHLLQVGGSCTTRAAARNNHAPKKKRRTGKHRFTMCAGMGGVGWWWWCCSSVSHFLRSVFKDLKLLSVIMVVWLAIVILVMIEIGVFNNPTFVAWGPRPTLSFLHVPIDTSYKYGLLLIMIMVHTFVSGE